MDRLIDVRRQVENDDFSLQSVREGQARRVLELQCISGIELRAVRFDRAASYVHVDPASLIDPKGRLLTAIEQAGVHAGVLVDAHRTLRPIGRSDEAQPTPLFLSRETLLLVARL